MTVNVSTFGAVGDGFTDDTAALQNAINSAQTLNQTLVLEENKRYKVTQPLIVKQGRVSKTAPLFEFDLDGQFSKIINAGTGFAIEVQPLASLDPAVNPDGGVNAIGSISMQRFDIEAPSQYNIAGGVKVGRQGYWMYANARRTLLCDVNLYQLGGCGLSVINAAHFDVVRVTQRDDFNGVGEGLYLAALGENAFCGDISFIDCQFQGNTSSHINNKPLSIQSYSPNTAKPASEAVRTASMREFEYHCDLAEYLGYAGIGRDDFCVNVHGGARSTVDSWDWSWARLSKRAKRLISLENDEFSWSSFAMLRLCEHLGVRYVYDVHHDWVNRGVWQEPHGKLVKRIRATWDGFNPKIHLSTPLPEAVSASHRDYPSPLKEVRFTLVGASPRAYRAHSNYVWHPGLVAYAKRWFDAGVDIQLEAKAKNLASFALIRAIRR